MTIHCITRKCTAAIAIATFGIMSWSTAAWAQAIQHDTEHYVLLHQYAEQWAAEDKEMEQKLAEIREKNGGKPPNIVYILIDDMGFGEFGIPELSKIRGSRTPNIDDLA